MPSRAVIALHIVNAVVTDPQPINDMQTFPDSPTGSRLPPSQLSQCASCMLKAAGLDNQTEALPLQLNTDYDWGKFDGYNGNLNGEDE